jgi:hypothetical protein
MTGQQSVMSGQVPDTIVLSDKTFSITGIHSSGDIFDPFTLGIYPFRSTACWRGFSSDYSIQDNRLHLSSIKMALTKKGAEYPKILGALPRICRHEGMVYENLQYPLNFCGALLLGSGFFSDLYEHGGYQKGWKYTEVKEVVFESGRVEKVIDRSAVMKGFREELVKTGERDRESRMTRLLSFGYMPLG